MKTISLAQARADLNAVLDSAQKERIVVLRAGKPSAVLVGIEGYDAEDLYLATSPDFWKLIQERRQGRLVPLSEVKARLEGRETSRPSLKKAKTPRKRPPKPRT
jgi:prevent-host-death family protein